MAGFDTVIVGAGAAGIAAARQLLAAGRRVLVLEARHRVGGRAVTDQRLGAPADLGAAWLHFADENAWTGIAEREGFTILFESILKNDLGAVATRRRHLRSRRVFRHRH